MASTNIIHNYNEYLRSYNEFLLCKVQKDKYRYEVSRIKILTGILNSKIKYGISYKHVIY